MHFVLQQKWVDGKSCLAEKDELDALLDLLSLSSDTVSDKGEEDIMPSHVLSSDEAQEDEVAIETNEDGDKQVDEDKDTPLVEIEAGKENEEKADAVEVEVEDKAIAEGEVLEESLAGDRYGIVNTWYYLPNGSLVKGF